MAKQSVILTEKRDGLLAKSESIVATAQTEARDLTSEEDGEIAAMLDEIRSLDDQINRHAELEERMAKADAMRKHEITEAVTTVKSEPRTYTPQAPHSFIGDAYAAQFRSDYGAQERLARHMREEQIERRDVGTANFAGLVVPQYLTDLAAPLARAGRPLADVARKHPLPASGMTINISRVTTGSTTTAQSEGSAVSETNIDDTLLTVNVQTIAGQQNVSRQALERGTGVDAIVAADLIAAYHTTLDNRLVAQMRTDVAANGNVVVYNDASPTVPELYKKLLDGVQKIQTTYFGGPNLLVMHPRRLAFILAALDGSNRPLAVPMPQGPENAFATGEGAVRYGNSGYAIAGLPVLTDANISITEGVGTDEDNIYIINTQELHLWEQGGGAPFYLRFEEPKSAELEVKLVVYGYSAFTAARQPKAFTLIDGTGLVTPTF